MSKKLMLIIVPTVGLLSFGLMFAVAWFTRPDPSEKTVAQQQTEQVQQQQQQQLGLGQAPPTGVPEPVVEKTQQRMMSEKMLQDLVRMAKEKIEQYDLKLASLSQQEERIKMSQKTLSEEIDQLEVLRVEVADAIASLKVERNKLQQTRITIKQDEQDNLQKVAKAYAAMKEKASPLLIDLCQDLESPDGREKVKTAVKILYHIDEKTQAKIFSAMTRQHADIVGMLTMELKRVAVEPVEN